MNRETIWMAIVTERLRQEERWGGSHGWGEGSCSSLTLPDIVKAAVLGEEAGEVQRAVLDRDPNLKEELVQVAAVAVAWLESIDVPGSDYSVVGP